MNERYLQYLKSKDWSGKRAKRLEATDASCDICGTVNWSNDVHHVKYAKNLEDVRLWDLKVLCRRCHQAVHRAIDIRGKQINKSRNSIVRWNLTLHAMIDESLLEQSVLNRIRKRLKLKQVKIPHDPRLPTTECDDYQKKPKPSRGNKKQPKRESLAQERMRLKRERRAKKKALKESIRETEEAIARGKRVLL